MLFPVNAAGNLIYVCRRATESILASRMRTHWRSLHARINLALHGKEYEARTGEGSEWRRRRRRWKFDAVSYLHQSHGRVRWCRRCLCDDEVAWETEITSQNWRIFFVFFISIEFHTVFIFLSYQLLSIT